MLIEAAPIEIIKLQEIPKEYSGAPDLIMLNTKTSGWTVCQEYAVSFWVKKLSWIGTTGWHLFIRLANAAQ